MGDDGGRWGRWDGGDDGDDVEDGDDGGDEDDEDDDNVDDSKDDDDGEGCEGASHTFLWHCVRLRPPCPTESGLGGRRAYLSLAVRASLRLVVPASRGRRGTAAGDHCQQPLPDAVEAAMSDRVWARRTPAAAVGCMPL